MFADKPKVYVTRKIPDQALALLRKECNVRMWDKEETPVPRHILEQEIAEADGLYCLLTEKIDSELLHGAANLKVISTMAVGYNNIDIQSATERNIIVTNTPDVLTETTADLTFALLLATARRLVEASDLLRNGAWKTWSPLLLAGQDVYGATLGIIGLGSIGKAVARRAKGFSMRVLYASRTRKPGAEQELGLEYVEMESLLKESDFICIMTTYTPETRNMIGSEQLALMKPNAILINTARGGIVNEVELCEALAQEKIWAAGLDVFEQEPLPMDSPLLGLKNMVTLPHIGSASQSTRIRMAGLAAENMVQALQGQMPRNPVNPEAWDETNRR